MDVHGAPKYMHKNTHDTPLPPSNYQLRFMELVLRKPKNDLAFYLFAVSACLIIVTF